jgi:hypothetical protein
MRRPAEFFDDEEIALVHIATTLRRALRLEALLTEHGLDYAVEADRYMSGFLFVTAKTGAFFYVLARDAEAARALLSRHRYKVHRDE